MSHTAAMVSSAGIPLSVVSRATPTPGPNEVLVAVKAIAFNPVDIAQRDMGLFIESYPAVVGCDVAGVIEARGADVTDSAYQPGTRVTALASSFYMQGNPDYGAMQEKVVVPIAAVTPLPDTLGFREACILPLSVFVSWTGWTVLDIPHERNVANSSSVSKTPGVIVWGAGSSMGTSAVQTARWLGFTVYATASPKHSTYLHGLGVSRVFDYKSPVSVLKTEISQAMEQDNLSINKVFLAAGQVAPAIEILRAIKPDSERGIIASAPLVPADLPPLGDDLEVNFILPPSDPVAREQLAGWIFNSWLPGHLASGEFVPGPAVRVVGCGLEAANTALNELRGGVSGEKLVIDISGDV
ncbi:hypothetical protein ASPZODRAFT_151254 [Penicilliopsis zonata CBS 506.65]|uniref:Enoyl reductase (ER) domain-containing protein n=1 Tax=Penicilliopsis zonata CBS 506.65 TaxID=1073090 RepID=A0A1L9SKW4_9EURO|nr:hypothetical protein ASPZODRAFT_151254 [Penicilliopsis zonata CBS 506.65]OJJ47815.1 hypothetical protein ASPZODRAFT_151254 [Penicilliopsis zonata CBS 506.65]